MPEEPADARALGRYQLFAKLGSGGQAEVFLAVARGTLGLDKLVVIKRVHAASADDPTKVGDFLAEARLALRLNHPNLVHTYEVGQEGGFHFLAMEHIEGLSLRELFDAPRSRELPTAMWLRIIADALAGLASAHGLRDYDGKLLGMIHRDISPHNILVSYDGVTKVLDFGIAAVGAADAGPLVGKLSYMAPEQARGRADRRSDVFAMGVVLWEMISGKRLLPAATLESRQRGAELPRLREVVAGVEEELDELVARALASDPAQRFGSANEMRQAIERLLRRGGHVVREHEISDALAAAFGEERARLAAQIQEAMRGASDRAPVELPQLVEELGAASATPAPRAPERVPPDEVPAPPAAAPPREPVAPRRTGRLWRAIAVGLSVAAVALFAWRAARGVGGQDARRAAAPAPRRACAHPLRVRVMYDMTGATRAVGTAAGKGELDYLRSLAAAGGVAGCPLEIDVADTRYDKATALEVYRGWKARPDWREVAVIFVQGTPMTQVLGPLAAEDDKVIISGAYAGELAAPLPTAFDVEVPSLSEAFVAAAVTLRKQSPGYSHVFFQGTDYTTAARVAATYVWRQGGRRMGFFFCSTSAFCTDPVDGAKTFLSRLGGTQIGRDLSVELDDPPAEVERKVVRYFQQEVARRNAHPAYEPVDWIWLGNTSATTKAIAPALEQVRRTLGLRVQVIGNNWAVDESLHAQCGAACVGFFAVQPFTPFGEPSVRGTAAMLADHAAYRARDGEPASAHRSVQYVYGRVAVATWRIAVERLLARGAPVTGASLRQELERFHNVDVEGFATIGYSATDHRPQAGARITRAGASGALELVGQPVALALAPSWLGW